MRPIVLASGLLACALAGCNHDGLITMFPDGGPPDLTQPLAPDLTQSVCRTHQILSVVLDDIQPVQPLQPVGPRTGSSLMLRVAFSLRENCDVPGDINVRVMPGNATDFVVITMRTWRGSNDCGAPKSAYRTVTLGPDLGIGNPMVLITDGAPGGTKMIRLQLANGGVPNCAVARRYYEPCDGDCQCMASDKSTRCLSDAGASFRCAVPCSEDVECAVAGIPEKVACSPVSVCDDCTGQPGCGCASDGSCPFGQACASGLCKPLTAVPGGACNCDGECGPGRLCDQAHACFIPCTTAADCGAPATICDGGRCR